MCTSSKLLFAFLLSTFLILSVESGPVKGKLHVHPWFGAECIARSTRCSTFFTKYTEERCVENTKWDQQPPECYEFVCPWCTEFKGRASNAPCGSDEVVNACADYLSGVYDGSDRSNDNYEPKREDKGVPSQEEEESEQDSIPKHGGNRNDGKCVWTGEKDNIVIDLGKVPLVTGWDSVNRDGYEGIIFARSPARGISPKGKYGMMCFDVQAPMDGKYYLTAISYAPHVTEHNDVWVTTSKGMELWQSGNQHSFEEPMEWHKAYQNNGKKGISEHFKTIDFDGHRFLVPNIKQDEIFQVCIAGRSKKYEMYRLILKNCEDKYCEGKIMKGDMLFDLEPSKCK